MNSLRYWIGTASRDHVERGVAEGFAQLCHGKATVLKRMQPGDWLIYYSARLHFEQKEPYQAFTAIGQITGEEIYQVAIAPEFMPWRRSVHYLKSQDAPIKPLLAQLSFITDPQHWGYPFRRGQFQIGLEDFRRIAIAMGIDL